METKNTAFVQEQYDAIYPNGIEYHYWQKSRVDIIYNILKQNEILNLKYLEIGCGKGVVIQSLRQKKIDVYGVELANITALPTVEHYVSTGVSFADLDNETRQEYTGIFLFDVIEHIEYPETFISEIFDKYENVKHIVLTVPAMQNIWSNYDEFNGHFKRYELKDLLHLASMINCEIIDQGYFFHSLYPMAKLLLKYQSNRSLEIKAPKGAMRLLHKLVAFNFYWEYKLLSKSLAGSSLFFVLSRK